jgi:KDO2-lipid IV(A) lauroyltransferase
VLFRSWIESEIRRNPAQYLWVHRRFKTRPRGEPRLYAD